MPFIDKCLVNNGIIYFKAKSVSDFKMKVLPRVLNPNQASNICPNHWMGSGLFYEVIFRSDNYFSLRPSL